MRVDLDMTERLIADRPRVFARDDGMVHTHDDARDLMKYAALGATVLIEPFDLDDLPGARRYTVVLDAAPYDAANAADMYHLPVNARVLAQRVRQIADDARTALARRRLNVTQ